MKNDGDDTDSPKKHSRFSSKNEEETSLDILRKKSMCSPSELHKLAIINNMKEKMPNYEFEIPDENSPLQDSIKNYQSLEAKSKNYK